MRVAREGVVVADRVVVGRGDEIQPGSLRQAHHVRRLIRAVAVDRVHVEVALEPAQPLGRAAHRYRHPAALRRDAVGGHDDRPAPRRQGAGQVAGGGPFAAHGVAVARAATPSADALRVAQAQVDQLPGERHAFDRAGNRYLLRAGRHVERDLDEPPVVGGRQGQLRDRRLGIRAGIGGAVHVVSHEQPPTPWWSRV